MTRGIECSVTLQRIILLTAAALLAAAGPAPAQEKRKVDKAAEKEAAAHMKEELGVNQFTTPSIETIIMALKELRPIAYEKASRDFSDSVPGDRARLALSTGSVIAEGFLIVSAEKQSRLADIGRVLIRHAKGLGVGDGVTRHSKSILEKGAAKDWDAVRQELVATQRDVEKAMMALKDEEIAHLVALGGWARGLEITAGLVADQYTPARAAILVQPAVLDYFIQRVQTLNPTLKKTKLFATVEKNLSEIRKLALKEGGAPPAVDDLRKIHAFCGEIISLVQKQDE